MPLVCLTDFQAYAREHLSKSTWDFIEGGADDCCTRDDNMAAFKKSGLPQLHLISGCCDVTTAEPSNCDKDLMALSLKYMPSNPLQKMFADLCDTEARKNWKMGHKHRIRLRPRYLKDVSKVDMRTTIQGAEISSPICIAPTGFHRLAWPDGEMSTARAAQAASICYITSTYASCSLEDIVAAAPRGLRWFQLYVHPNRQINKQMIQKVESLGFKALVITVDVPKLGNRRNDIKNQVDLMKKLLLKDFGSPEMGNAMPYFQMSPIDPSICWEDLSWFQSMTRLPIILKGILTKEDAELAVKHNVHGIIVSNHGGRQLDEVPASIDALTEVVAAVKGKVEVYLDGGVRTGNDVLKALALGAKCVFVGRPILWGLAYKGEHGVKEVLDILKNEFHTSMTLTGCRSVTEINHDLIQFSRL